MNAFATLLMVLLSCSGTGPQVDIDATAQAPTSCEIAILRLETAMKAAGSNETIKVVAHRGTLDNRTDVVQRRLFNVVAFLTDFYPTKRLPPDRVVSIEGDRVHGHGTIELYVNGQSIGTLVARPDRDIVVGHCDDRDPTERRFFPWRERRP